ncbi:Putative zinc ribbon domain-containing protein [Flavobacterium omnivorum]|uniref:Putative zinc ribbon domain-containing protein n=1 Tax=Flavobacterium omnivorum TaxID=178355 RepID=A0A1G8ALN9_9FLAO|nr:zinc ribbon domain-containing protein [Flavobacterium omnivorum]SDH21763.1 Putative zinc ribbon domain-containing protein [Flavobacterium omnivorum]
MEIIPFCQSCGMPLASEEVKGTENTGHKTSDYCKYCYEDSQFKQPDMNLEDMKNMVKVHMQKKKHPDYMIQKAMNLLPALTRWKNSPLFM